MYHPIVREQLIARLDDARCVPLTMLVAPPGAGKTILLNQWQSIHPEHDVARLNLSLRDRDPMVFFRRLVDCLKAHSDFLDIPTFNLFLQEMACPDSAICDALLTALETVETPLYIVLDDFQCVDAGMVHQVISAVAAGLPAHIHLIISSRCYPDFSLTKFQYAGQLLLLTSADLHMDTQQIRDLSRRVVSVSLSEQSIARIGEITEGWAVAINMALMAVQKHGEAALTSFQGSRPELVDYFGHVVLDTIPEHAQRFLCQCAFLEVFDRPLLMLLAERESFKEPLPVVQSADELQADYRYTIQQIIDQGLFIIPTEDGLFRFHGLLREFLLSRSFTLFSQAQLTRWQLILSEAWEARSRQNSLTPKERVYCLDQAVKHACVSKDAAAYHGALTRVCEYLGKQGHLTDLIQALSELSDDDLLNNPGLLEWLLFSLTFSRRFHQAQFYLNLAHSSLLSNLPMIRLLTLTLKVFVNDNDHESAKELTLMSEEAQQSPLIKSLSLLIVAYFQLQRGALGLSYESADQAKSRLAEQGHTYLASYADLILALCDRSMGRGVSAVMYMREKYHEVAYQQELPAWLNLATGMVVVHYEQNQISAAKQLCERLLPKVNGSSATEVVTTVYLHLARFLFLEGDKKRSERLLDRLERILVLGQYQRFKAQVIQEYMRQALKDRNLPKATRILAKYDLLNVWQQFGEVVDGRYCEAYERYGLTISYYYQLIEDFSEASVVLERIAEMSESSRVYARALVARSNQVVLESVSGSSEFAVTKLQQLLNENGFEAFSRSVLDESPGLVDVMRYMEINGRLALPESYQVMFADCFPLAEQSKSLPKKELLLGGLNDLTQKEKEIYELLVSGLSNSMISERLGIALSTTKWHLKNIYGKLGVKNRTNAIVLARQVL